MNKKIFQATIEIKDGDTELGKFRATIATLNVKDRDGEVTLPGAFQRGQKVKIAAFGHNWNSLPVGIGTIGADAEHAWVDGQFNLNTVAGKEHYETVKFTGPQQEWSYGFEVTKESQGLFEGANVRFLEGLNVFEASPVMVGAGLNTRTDFIKSADSDEESDEASDPDAAAKATWSTAFVNNLPDSSFAVILPGGEKDADGKTTPRDLRKLPHHGADGALDLPHLRNALSREPQTDMPDDLHAKAHAHLMRHASGAGMDMGKQFSDVLEAFLAEFGQTPPADDAERQQLLALGKRLGKAQRELELLLKRSDPINQVEPRNQYRRFQELSARHGLASATPGRA